MPLVTYDFILASQPYLVTNLLVQTADGNVCLEGHTNDWTDCCRVLVVVSIVCCLQELYSHTRCFLQTNAAPTAGVVDSTYGFLPGLTHIPARHLIPAGAEMVSISKAFGVENC